MPEGSYLSLYYLWWVITDTSLFRVNFVVGSALEVLMIVRHTAATTMGELWINNFHYSQVLEGIWHTWGHTARSQVEGVCRPRVLPLSGLRVKCLGFHRFTLHCFPLALLWGLHDVIFWRDSVNLRAAYSEGINSLLTRDVSVFSYITNCWPQVSAGMPQCIKETS